MLCSYSSYQVKDLKTRKYVFTSKRTEIWRKTCSEGLPLILPPFSRCFQSAHYVSWTCAYRVPAAHSSSSEGRVGIKFPLAPSLCCPSLLSSQRLQAASNGDSAPCSLYKEGKTTRTDLEMLFKYQQECLLQENLLKQASWQNLHGASTIYG